MDNVKKLHSKNNQFSFVISNIIVNVLTIKFTNDLSSVYFKILIVSRKMIFIYNIYNKIIEV